MNKFLKRILAFGLLAMMTFGATGCELTSSPIEELTGVEKVIADARAETDERIEEIRNTPNI